MNELEIIILEDGSILFPWFSYTFKDMIESVSDKSIEENANIQKLTTINDDLYFCG